MSRRFPSPFPFPSRSPSRLLFRSQKFPSHRHASATPSYPRRFLSTTLFLGTGVVLIAYYYDSRSIIHEHVAMPFIRFVADPETGHRFGVRLLALSRWARPRDMGTDGEALGTEVRRLDPRLKLMAQLFGMKVDNPVGIGAGLDKDGQAIDGLFDLGFGYVEIGSVTPEPQVSLPRS